MIDNVDVAIPWQEQETAPVADYFYLGSMPGKFLVIQRENSNFYFLCTEEFPIDKMSIEFDWYIVSKDHFNDELYIGMGLADESQLIAELYRVDDVATLFLWRDILRFTFEGDFIKQFFPYTNHFKGKLKIDGNLCFYIHDYHPVSHPGKLDVQDKKVSNLIFRFKEGKSKALVAKLFSLAISRMPFYKKAKNPVLIPIAASTRERHRERFASFCSHLARRLNILDGYRAIWITGDREQLKGTRGTNKIAHVAFNKKHIVGKDIFLVDDVLTTGASFRQTAQVLKKMGANSVVGLFLGKTI